MKQRFTIACLASIIATACAGPATIAPPPTQSPATQVPPTATPVPATATPVVPTATALPPTATALPPKPTAIPVVVPVTSIDKPFISDDKAYIKPSASGVVITPLLTVAEVVPNTSDLTKGYRMVGIPDGLGMAKAKDGSIRLMMNHELRASASAPLVNASVITGAFVSEYVIAPKGGVISGDLAFKKVMNWDGKAWQDLTNDWQSGKNSFTRFCSAFMAGAAEGLTDNILLLGEESGGSDTFDKKGGQAVAIVDGTSYVLPEMGRYAKENVVIAPGTGNRTIAIGLDDSNEGQLYMYAGTKNVSATNPIERAGLVGGDLYFWKSTDSKKAGEIDFHKGDTPLTGEWVKVQNTLLPTETVTSINDITLNMRSVQGGAFNFIRLEDGEFDLRNPGKFYFVTTGSGVTVTTSAGITIPNKLGRLYEFTFDPKNPISGTTQLKILLEADKGDPIINPDNIALNAQGQLMIQEDATAEGEVAMSKAKRDAAIWLYDLNTKALTRIAEIDQLSVPAEARNGYGYWESTGIIDASATFGPGAWLFNIQAHSINITNATKYQGYGVDSQVVEGGQLLLMRVTNPAPIPTPTIIKAYNLPNISISSVMSNVLPNTIINDRKILLGGVGSGLWRNANDPANEFWMITDRGPNGQIRVNDVNRRTFPIPEYTPLILNVRVEGESIKILQTIPIIGQSGKGVTGLSNLDKIDEIPYTFDAKTELTYNVNGMDLEGIVRTKDGGFWVVDEYSPSIVRVGKDGKVIKRYVPQGLKLSGTDYPVAETLPAIFAKRKGNRGFEDVAISGDEKTLYIALQSPLSNPDRKVGDPSRNTRIIAFDIASEKITAEYAYRFDAARDFDPNPKITPDEMKLSGLLWINANTLIVLERTDDVTKLYSVDISKASNILGSKWDDATTTPSFESLDDLGKNEINPLPKTLVVDTGKFPQIPKKLEGIALVDASTIALANDNDFALGEIDAAGNFAFDGTRSQILFIKLLKPLQ